MLSRPLGVTRFRGIEVRLDPSLLLLALLIVWVFTTRFSGTYPLVTSLAMAAAGALLVVLTTFAHELAHALEARHRGMRVEAITLLLFGGVTEMHAHGQRARDEVAVAAVGPWVSLVCGALLGLASVGAAEGLPSAVGEPVAELAGLLAWWNVLLALFNIFPAAPLDGGRVLRALLWMLLGDRLRGLRVSVRAGQLLGVALVGGGAWVLTRAAAASAPVPLGLFALLLAGTGVFLFAAAGRELRHAEYDAAMSGWSVGRLVAALDPDPRALPVDDALPRVDVADDLHELVDAFQSGAGAVRVTSSGIGLTVLSEAEVAAALARLRRWGDPVAVPASSEGGAGGQAAEGPGR